MFNSHWTKFDKDNMMRQYPKSKLGTEKAVWRVTKPETQIGHRPHNYYNISSPSKTEFCCLLNHVIWWVIFEPLSFPLISLADSHFWYISNHLEPLRIYLWLNAYNCLHIHCTKERLWNFFCEVCVFLTFMMKENVFSRVYRCEEQEKCGKGCVF